MTVQETDVSVDSAYPPCKSWETIRQLDVRAIKSIFMPWVSYLTFGNLSQGDNLKEESNSSSWCPLSVPVISGCSGWPGPESTMLLVGGTWPVHEYVFALVDVHGQLWDFSRRMQKDPREDIDEDHGWWEGLSLQHPRTGCLTGFDASREKQKEQN